MKTLKTETRRIRRYTEIAAILVLFTMCCHVDVRAKGKPVKPPRVGPAPEVRRINMPEGYLPEAAAAGRSQEGLAASKPGRSPAPWTVVRESAHQTPIFLEINHPEGAAAKSAAGVGPRAQVLQFITDNKALFRLRDPSSELVHRATHEDRTERKHVQLDQRYQGVPVWGASIVGHWSAEQGLYAINGRYQPSPDYISQVEPSITREAAVDLAVGDLKLHTSVKTLSTRMQELLDYDGPDGELYLWSATTEDRLRLTWCLEIRPNLHERWRYFVDAHTGEILERYQASPSDGPAVGSGVDLHGNTVDLHTYEEDGLFTLIDGSREGFDPESLDGALATLDADSTDVVEIYPVISTDNVFNDPVAVSAHVNMARTYEYFLEEHGRAGVVGDGTGVISVIHVTNEGSPMDNAYWNGVLMAYGDGGDAFSPLAGALDVGAHEMAHGIIEHTVGLEYRFQSGALNESFADIFGAMVDEDDWLIGEDIVNKAHFPSGAMRNLQDPHNGADPGGSGWQPAHMDDYVELELAVDNGGVHVNSGIPNRAAYLVAEAIGRDRAAQIYYRILEARYLAPRSQFIDCRFAAERAARDLFGESSTEAAAVSRAYDAVGIAVEEAPDPPPVGPPADPGAQWVAAVAAELDGDNSLWLVKPTADALEGAEGWEYITQLTETQVFIGSSSPVTAPVNSDFLIFVDSDNNLRIINADGTGEEVISEDGDWASISISSDGSRLAATSVYDEPVIWYLDLVRPDSSRAIALCQPTTQDGICQDIARFADALQWDPTGTYLYYDVLNSLPDQHGGTIDFWTVNALDPSDDVIWSIFPPQPEGVQLAYPSLSSAVLPDGTIDHCRLLFERVDNLNARTEIKVIDFCTGNEGTLFTIPEAVFTFPGYTNNDEEIVFQSGSVEDGVATAHLFRLPLSDDGISAKEDPLVFVSYAKFPRTFVLNSATSAVIAGAASPPAPDPDFDGDGTVGFADFLQFAAQFGLSQANAGYDARFDLDSDGVVGFSDFVIFASSFGN